MVIPSLQTDPGPEAGLRRYSLPRGKYNNWVISNCNNTHLFLQVGGKNFEQSMENVDEFVGQLRARLSELGFRRTVAFLDENFTASEKYESKLSSGFFY